MHRPYGLVCTQTCICDLIDCLYVYTYLYAHHNNHHSLWRQPLLLLPVEPTTETGPNDFIVVWAPGKFYSLLVIFRLTYIFHVLHVLMHINEMTSGRWWQPLMGPQKHPQPPPQATAHWVGMGASTKQQENSNVATKPNKDGMRMKQWETMGRQQRGGKANKKRPKRPNDIFWAIGKFFSSHFIFLLLTNLFSY